MTRRRPNNLALAIERNEWERAALLLLIGLTRAADRVPRETLDDLLLLLAALEDGDASRHD